MSSVIYAYEPLFLSVMLEETKKKFGVPDVVINNAGILSDAKWAQTCAVNIVRSAITYVITISYVWML